MRIPRLVTAAVAVVVALGLAGCDPVETGSHSKSKSKAHSNSTSKSKSTTTSSSTTKVKIQTTKSVCWKGKVEGASKSGCGSKTINVRASSDGVQVRIQKTKGDGKLVVVLVVEGQTVDHAQVSGSSGVVSLSYDNS
jgi:flagellar hook assembly protein FlgD